MKPREGGRREGMAGMEGERGVAQGGQAQGVRVRNGGRFCGAREGLDRRGPRWQSAARPGSLASGAELARARRAPARSAESRAAAPTTSCAPLLAPLGRQPCRIPARGPRRVWVWRLRARTVADVALAVAVPREVGRERERVEAARLGLFDHLLQQPAVLPHVELEDLGARAAADQRGGEGTRSGRARAAGAPRGGAARVRSERAARWCQRTELRARSTSTANAPEARCPLPPARRLAAVARARPRAPGTRAAARCPRRQGEPRSAARAHFGDIVDARRAERREAVHGPVVRRGGGRGALALVVEHAVAGGRARKEGQLHVAAEDLGREVERRLQAGEHVVVHLQLRERVLRAPEDDLVIRARVEVVKHHFVRAHFGALPQVGDVDRGAQALL